MTILLLMIPATLLLVLLFVLGYIWAARTGQFDDLDTPAHRALLEDPPLTPKLKLTLKSVDEDSQKGTSP